MMETELADISAEEFKNPPKSARPMVRWWWTGLEVEEVELITEIKEMDEVGFYGAEVQVFMIGMPWKLEKKDPKRAAVCHRFMQPYYYEMLKAVMDEASKRNMIIDLTIGSAWPAGGVHISKDESLKTMLVGAKTLKGPKKSQINPPKFKKPLTYRILGLSKYIIGYNLAEYFKKDMELVALIAAKPVKKAAKIKYLKPKTTFIERDSIIDLTEKVNENGKLEWDIPEGKWQIFAFYTGPSGTRPLLDCKSTPDKYSLVMDHLSSTSVKMHMDSHLGEGLKYFKEHYGNTFRAFFTDSLELGSEWLWSDDFLEQFLQRRGYNLRPFLPLCIVPNRDNNYAQALSGENIPIVDVKEDMGERIRYDVELTISDLFTEEFCGTMSKWAEKNKIQSRIQSYGIRADTLKAYGISHIPETEQLYAGGMINFLKLAGSAGIIYNKPIIAAESIVWNQRDYMTTPLKMKVAADRLFISGVNQMIYHGFPYQNPRFKYPGYCGFSTSFIPRRMNFASNFSRMNPFWEFLPVINQYITRCQLILQRGKTECNVVIFFPKFNFNNTVLKEEELVGGFLDEYDAPKAKGQVNAHLKKLKKLDKDDKWNQKLIEITDNLMSNGFNYAHINEECLLKSQNESSKLYLNGNQYDVLILPNIEAITLKLAEKLHSLAKTGVKILFLNTIPSKQPGYKNYEENDKKITDLMDDIISKNEANFNENLSNISQILITELNIKPGIRYNETQDSIYYIHKITNSSNYYFLRNAQNQAKTVNVSFNHPNKIPFILDPWTGKISQAVQYIKTDKQIEMNLFFPPYSSKIIEFKEASEDTYLKNCSEHAKRVDNSIIDYLEHEALDNIHIMNWTLAVNIREHNGNLIPHKFTLDEPTEYLNIEGLKYCSGRGTYSSSFSISDEYLKDDIKLILSLNRIHDVAVVKINEEVLPPLMIYPYELDVTPQIKSGENELSIEIIPTIRNRLIGYGKKGGKRWRNHKKKKEFMPSGLVGPILIKIMKEVILS